MPNICAPPLLTLLFGHFQATQKGDPVAILKRQLEEKEKLLATEQEDAAAAKSKLRELNKVRLNAHAVPSTPSAASTSWAALPPLDSLLALAGLGLPLTPGNLWPREGLWLSTG